jgi:hypothetical protein
LIDGAPHPAVVRSLRDGVPRGKLREARRRAIEAPPQTSCTVAPSGRVPRRGTDSRLPRAGS